MAIDIYTYIYSFLTYLLCSKYYLIGLIKSIFTLTEDRFDIIQNSDLDS